MSKTYKPSEVICVINDEEIEGLSPEAVECLVKKKDCSHFWCHSHCGKYKKCIKCDEIVELETYGGVFGKMEVNNYPSSVKYFKIGTFEELYPEFSKILDDNFIFLITNEEDDENSN